MKAYLCLYSLCGALLVFGCSGADDHDPYSGGSALEVRLPAVASPVCTDGEQRDCHYNVSVHNGVATCLKGAQTCVNGGWGDCEIVAAADKSGAGGADAGGSGGDGGTHDE